MLVKIPDVDIQLKVPQLPLSLLLLWPKLYEEFEPKQTLKIHQIILSSYKNILN